MSDKKNNQSHNRMCPRCDGIGQKSYYLKPEQIEGEDKCEVCKGRGFVQTRSDRK